MSYKRLRFKEYKSYSRLHRLSVAHLELEPDFLMPSVRFMLYFHPTFWQTHISFMVCHRLGSPKSRPSDSLIQGSLLGYPQDQHLWKG